MKTVVSIKITLVSILALACLVLPARADDLVVPKGSSKQIPVAEGIRKVTVGNPNIIDARPTDDGRTLIVNGVGEGASELVIERLQGTNLFYKVVVRADLAQLLEQIKELLSDVEGLEIKTVGDKIVLKGNIVTKSGYDRVAQVVAAYSGVLLNMSKFDRTEMNKYVEAAIVKDIGLDSVTAKVTEDTVMLEGIVYSEAEKERATEIARLKQPNVKNLLRVQEVMIESDMQFIQVDSVSGKDTGYNVLKNMGIDVGGEMKGGGTGKPTATWGVSGSASVKINALVSSGQGKILIQKNVSAKSGTEGTAMVGGELGIAVSGNVGGSVEKIKYGMLLKVTPTLQGRDTILSKVSVEVSRPIPAGRNAYALDKSETSTTVMCKVGESIVLSGLVEALSSGNAEKTPGVGDIPLLNLFFSEKTSSKVKKELLVVLTPRVLFPDAAKGPAFSEERKQSLEGTDPTKK